MKMNYMVFGVGMFLLVLLSGYVRGAGIALPNWEGNPAMVYPGQEGDIEINLQNAVGDQDLIFDVTYTDGGISASLPNSEYYVTAGSTNTITLLHYVIPANAQPGDKYSVSLSVRTRSPNQEGGIEVGVGIDRSIPFEVVARPSLAPAEEQVSPNKTVWYVILVIIVIIALVYFIVRRRKK